MTGREPLMIEKGGAKRYLFGIKRVSTPVAFYMHAIIFAMPDLPLSSRAAGAELGRGARGFFLPEAPEAIRSFFSP